MAEMEKIAKSKKIDRTQTIAREHGAAKREADRFRDYSAIQVLNIHLATRDYNKTAQIANERNLGIGNHNRNTVSLLVNRGMELIREEVWGNLEDVRLKRVAYYMMLLDKLLGEDGVFERSRQARRKVHRTRTFKSDPDTGQRIIDKETEVIEEIPQAGSVKAIAEAAKINKEICRLYGIEAPQQIDALVTLDSDAAQERWSALPEHRRDALVQDLRQLMLPPGAMNRPKVLMGEVKKESEE